MMIERVTPHVNLVQVARENFDAAVLCIEKLNTQEETLAELTGDEASEFEFYEVSPVRDRLGNHCLISLVFSALAVEAYIYDYAARNLSDQFASKHLDRLSVVDKWVVIPKLVTGKDFPKDGRGFQLLKQLAANRNYIVHSKSVKLQVLDEQTSDLVIGQAAIKRFEFSRSLLEKAKEAIKALDELSLIMESLDPSEMASVHLGAPVGQRKEHLDQYGI